MNRNKVSSFGEKALKNLLQATKIRMAKYAGKRFGEVLQEEINLIEDVLKTGDFAPPGGTYKEEHAKKLASKEFQARVAAKLAG